MDDLIETNENSILDFQKTLQSAFEMLKGVKLGTLNFYRLSAAFPKYTDV